MSPSVPVGLSPLTWGSPSTDSTPLRRLRFTTNWCHLPGSTRTLLVMMPVPEPVLNLEERKGRLVSVSPCRKVASVPWHGGCCVPGSPHPSPPELIRTLQSPEVSTSPHFESAPLAFGTGENKIISAQISGAFLPFFPPASISFPSSAKKRPLTCWEKKKINFPHLLDFQFQTEISELTLLRSIPLTLEKNAAPFLVNWMLLFLSLHIRAQHPPAVLQGPFCSSSSTAPT